MAKKRSANTDEEQILRFFKVNQDSLRAMKRRIDRSSTRGTDEVADAQSDLIDLVDGPINDGLDDDFVFIDPYGDIVPKALMMKRLKTSRPIFNDYKRSQHKVKVIGDTAVTRSIVALKGNWEDFDVTGRYHEVHTLARVNGTWRLLTSQMTLITQREKLFPKANGKPER